MASSSPFEDSSNTLTTRSVADLIAAVAAATPAAPALRAGKASLTYGDLLASADRLAAHLLRLGIGPEIPVGICIERSFDEIIALLAVLRAGGAFLPLDPAWPATRLRHVLDEAQAPVVIAGPSLLDRLGGDGRIVLPAAAMTDKGSEPACPPQNIAADTLAYVIYTSGSSGEPKGVEITHGNLSNLVSWHWEAFGITADDHASHLAGLGFDASVWEIWPYLTKGACLHLPEDMTRNSPELLQQWLVAEGISVAFVPTPLAEPLIAAEWPEDVALRYLLTGGDTLHVRPRPDLPFAVVNNYGPTEATVVATSCAVQPGEGADALPAIGWPIANTRIHLLDSAGRTVPEGEIGEIHIGGAGVGRGYRRLPQLTAEKFPFDKFQHEPGARLYRTGDLGRRLPDGQIAFHGRIDDQMKIRGHRIEPDEIMAALNRHPLVSQSAVIGLGRAAEVRLAAYIVAAGTEPPSARELRRFLAALLPDYMIPASFVALAALPLTTSGKLDRAKLPEPSAANTLQDAAYRPPETMTEQRLARLVADLLGRPRIGTDDNFFLLGGHSLLGTQLILRAQDSFGVELTLRHLFEAPTVASLAARIEQLAYEKLAAMSEEEARQLVTP